MKVQPYASESPQTAASQRPRRLLAAVSAGRDASALFPDVVPVVAAACAAGGVVGVGGVGRVDPKKQPRGASLFIIRNKQC